jgi:glycosyltransferase involved in cell wall biosynthesis
MNLPESALPSAGGTPARMKILFLHKQILFPRDTGGKIRVLNLLKHLGRWHDVTYVCNLRPGEEALLPQMEELGLRMVPVSGEAPRRGGAGFLAAAAANLLSPRPYTIDRNYDPRVRRKVAELVAAEDFDLVICDAVQMARHVIGLELPPTVLFQHNVEAQILERHAQVSEGLLHRRYLFDQFRKMKSFEGGCGRHFDHVIAVSRQDERIFRERYGWNNVDAIDTAVDTDFFQPRPGQENPDRVMFLGSMDWMPNQDGVRFFADQVWPKVLDRHPSAVFHIVGRNPPASVQELARRQGIEVLGSVPDVRPHLAEAAVVTVPLLVGGGTRLKIYEAMAMAKPVVSTTIGAEGLPVEHGVHFLQTDAPQAMADAIVDLLQDSALRQRIGGAADDFVRENYGSESVSRQFESICRRVVARASSPGSVPVSPFPSSISPL